MKLKEIMKFLIENQNSANQNSKFLTIITNYPNSKKIMTFPLSTKLPKPILGNNNNNNNK